MPGMFLSKQIGVRKQHSLPLPPILSVSGHDYNHTAPLGPLSPKRRPLLVFSLLNCQNTWR